LLSEDLLIEELNLASHAERQSVCILQGPVCRVVIPIYVESAIAAKRGE